jgi:M6 family metalloprotease-like protein
MGPAAATPGAGGCVPVRTRVHHSEGVDSWNPAYPRPRGHLDAVMVFLSFPDSRPVLSTREVQADHFPGTSRFFATASYGRFRLRVHAVRRWLPMPTASTRYGIRRDWADADRARYLRDAIAVANRAVNFRKYAVVYLVADPDAPGVDSDATKVVNLASPIHADGVALRRLVTVFEGHPPDRNVLAHETGHVFDLPDLYYRPPSGSTADWDTHVGDWDLMGSQFGLAPDPFAWHKWRLGWLGRNQVRCVTRTARARWYDLSPSDAPGAPGRGTKLLVVPTGSGTALAIEARGGLGNDARACRKGVLLYRVRSDVGSGDGPIDVLDGHPGTSACAGTSVYAPLADAPLGVGESFAYDGEDGSTVRVTVAGLAADGAWTVKVTDG